MEIRWRSLLVLCLVVSVSFQVHGATRVVPTEYPTIGAAMSAAQTDDTIRVREGVYDEAIDFKEGVHLEGEGRDKVTVRRPAVDGPLLRIEQCASGSVNGIKFEATDTPEQGEAHPDQPPVIDVVNSAVDLAECEVLGGAGSGIRITGGGPVHVNGCELRNSKFAGIHVRNDAEAILTGNILSENFYGMTFSHGAKGTARANTCTKNRVHGIVAEGQGVAPLLVENACSENRWSGIHFGLGAQGRAENNRSTANGGSGIAVTGVGTMPELVGNVLEDNVLYGLWEETGTKLKSIGNTYTRNGCISSNELTRLLYQRRFDALEIIVNRLKKEKLTNSGFWQLDFFYDSLGDYADRITRGEEEEYLTLIDDWRKAKPESVAAAIVKARALLALAWRERGTGWARDVTDEGWEGYHRYGELAWTAALEAERLGVSDPDLFLLKAQVAHATGRSSGSSLNDLWNAFRGKRTVAVDEYLEAGISLEPTYLGYYGEQVRQLLPRWGGSVEEVEAFAAWSVEHGTKELGDALYALVATRAVEYEGVETIIKKYPFVPSRVLKGYRDFLRLYPESTYWMNRAARVAGIYSDRAMAREMFALIGNDWDNGVWAGVYHFQRWRDWAEGKGKNPRINPLAQAVNEGDAARVKQLLRDGADPNTLTESGESLLSIAIREEDYDTLRALLQGGADVNFETPEGSPPLLRAVWEYDSTALDLLLPYKPNPNVKDKEGRTPLVSMANRPDSKRVRLLLDLGADPTLTSNGRTALHCAASHRDRDAIAALLEKGADPNARNWSQHTALYVAAQQKDLAACKMMLEKGGDPNASHGDGWSPMFEAVEQGNLELLKLLVAHGGDVTRVEKDGWSMFHTAASIGSVPVLEYLLERHPEGVHSQTDAKRGLLHHAAKNGHVGMVRFLLTKGLDPNAEDAKGKTPLTEAAKHPEVVKLLERGGSGAG